MVQGRGLRAPSGFLVRPVASVACVLVRRAWRGVECKENRHTVGKLYSDDSRVSY